MNLPHVHLCIVQPWATCTRSVCSIRRVTSATSSAASARSDDGQKPAAPRRGELRFRRAPGVRCRHCAAPQLHLRQPRAARRRGASVSAGLHGIARASRRWSTTTRQRAGVRHAIPTRCRWCRCGLCALLAAAACRSQTGRSTCCSSAASTRAAAPDAERIEASGVAGGGASMARCTARNVTTARAGQGRIQLHFYDTAPLRAGARVSVPVTGHAGDLRAQRRSRAAGAVRGCVFWVAPER